MNYIEAVYYLGAGSVLKDQSDAGNRETPWLGVVSSFAQGPSFSGGQMQYTGSWCRYAGNRGFGVLPGLDGAAASVAYD